ncbi:MAG: hypothetical protein LJF04_18935 [Gemmatimonadetes bacterium]|nr:hypothetical protein [Gemmatimonadota bacterium]
MRIRLGLPALTIAVAAAGCTMVSKPRPPSPEPAPAAAESTRPEPKPWHETYGGQVELQGQKLLVLLELTGPGDGTVSATLHIDALGLEAQGDGTRRDGTLDLRLSYGGDCPGKLHLTVAPAEGEGALAGTLEAEDCTGTESGSIRLLRRSAERP